ncbi:MAG: efflux RND transporter periplasmic adaptor subunit [Bryobacteraceae bacterium]
MRLIHQCAVPARRECRGSSGRDRAAEWPASAALVLVLTAAAVLAGCEPQRAAVRTAPPVVEVAGVVVQDVPIVKEWIGTLDGSVNAEIRAQVSGYVMAQAYKEGSFVRKGQLLFEIDPRPFDAALSQARGNLAQAESNVQLTRANLAQSEARLGKADLDVKRYTPLAQTKAISQEEMDDAIQSQLEARAAVESARAAIAAGQAGVAAGKAAVYTAEVNLGFTRVAAPINGIAGIAMVQVGNLASPISGVLTTVSAVDPIKAYFTVSEQEYIAYHRGQGGLSPEMEIILADGSLYPHKGRLFLEDRQVDVGTGALRVAALLPNPGNFLRPGQYARVRSVVETQKGATLVPERAVSELQGSYQVAVVNRDNTVAIRNVRVGPRVGGLWVVEEGVQPGDRVVVQGLQKIRNGAAVNPKPYSQPAGAK